MSLAKTLAFTKATACGNDFLIAEAGSRSDHELADLTRYACSRNFGIGADGVEWLYPTDGADIRAHLLNADGSYAELSGNGTRCVAAYWASKHACEEVAVLTGAGVKRCRLSSRQGRTFQFEMRMGSTAEVGDELIVQAACHAVRGRNVWLGNPHFVVLGDSIPEDWREKGAALTSHPIFPQGTNVEFVRAIDSTRIEFRIWERGAGETQSSGTGSCASAVAAIAAGLATSPVVVRAAAGEQRVNWTPGEDLLLEGPADLICEGLLYL